MSDFTKIQKGLLKRLKASFAGLEQCEEVDLKDSYRLVDKKIKVPLRGIPIQVNLGPDGKSLYLYPEWRLNSAGPIEQDMDYILFDPDIFFSEVSGFVRLQDGDEITLGDNETSCVILNLSEELSRRHLTISNREGQLLFRDHGGKSGTCISPLTREKDLTRLHARRLKKLKTVQKIFGERIEAMAPEQALELIREVNGLMEKECYRPANKAGKPGGLIEIPDDKLPIIVGDLHTRLDNLLVVLTQNAFLDELQSGNAVLVILGDAVHSEVEGELDQMETSMLIMDFIFRLKLRFPEQVFYLRGNHDSFSADMSKQGVPQGILWRKLLKRDRGKAYLEEMQRYYDQLPYIACSRHFVCCHAGPPTFEVNREDLINLHDDGRLMGELTKNRIRTSSRLTGYSKADIKRLRKVLGVDQDTCLIVGHTPLSNDDTLWMNPCDSKNHCILYTGGEEWVGVMSLVGDRMLPFRYPVESLLALLDKE